LALERWIADISIWLICFVVAAVVEVIWRQNKHGAEEKGDQRDRQRKQYPGGFLGGPGNGEAIGRQWQWTTRLRIRASGQETMRLEGVYEKIQVKLRLVFSAMQGQCLAIGEHQRKFIRYFLAAACSTAAENRTR
jgi:hypothetical protein